MPSGCGVRRWEISLSVTGKAGIIFLLYARKLPAKSSVSFLFRYHHANDSVFNVLVKLHVIVFRRNIGTLPILFHQSNREIWEVSLYSYRHIFETNTSGSIDRRGSLRWKQFNQIHVPLPTIEEQKKISVCIDACDKEIKVLQRLADTLKTQKKGLMQKLLTGEIRVKV